MNIKKSKYWKIILPLLIVAKIVFIVFVFGAAKSEGETTIVEVEQQFTAVEIPEEISFAGEKMPLERFDVKEALDRELLSNAYFHSQTIRFIKLVPRYFPIIEPILKEKGIPDDFKYLAVAESNFNPRAISPARAVGFWQFMKGTAGDFGLEVNSEIDERYHVVKSTYAACDYLKKAYEKFGSWTMVAASYNRGMTGIQRQVDRQKTNSYYDLLITTETARYVYRIVALKLILENPEKYNFDIKDEEKYSIIPTKQVEVIGKVASFPDFAKEHGINYKLIKDFNPWLREAYLNNSSGKKYMIDIPILK